MGSDQPIDAATAAAQRSTSRDERPEATRSIEGIQDDVPQPRLHRRPLARDDRVPRARARPAAAARGRGRRRQDGARQGPRGDASARGSSGSSATRASTSTPRSTSGTTRARCSRSGCSRRAARPTRRPRTTSSAPEFLHPAAAAPGARGDRRRGPGPAHRRDRPRRRGVRGVPARDPVRLPGDRARDRHDPGRAAAAGDPHLEPDARGPRRAQAPLPLPLDRLPDAPRRSSRSSRPACPDAPERLAREVVAFVHRLREADLTKVPGHRRDARLGGGAAVARGAASCAPELVDETLGVVLKYEEDIRQVRGATAAPLPRRGAAAGAEAGTMATTHPAIARSLRRPDGRADRRPPPARPRRSGSGGRCGPPACRSTSAPPIDFARALTLVDIGDREQVRAAGAAVFVRRRDDREVYDRGLRPLVAPRAAARSPKPRARGPRRRRRRPRGRASRARPDEAGRGGHGDAPMTELATMGSRSATDVGRRAPRSRARSSRPTRTRAARSSATATSTG